MTVLLTSNLRQFMVMQNSMAGGTMEKMGNSSFLLSRGFILAIVFLRSVFVLLRGQVSPNKCDYSSRTLRNVQGGGGKVDAGSGSDADFLFSNSSSFYADCFQQCCRRLPGMQCVCSGCWWI